MSSFGVFDRSVILKNLGVAILFLGLNACILQQPGVNPNNPGGIKTQSDKTYVDFSVVKTINSGEKFGALNTVKNLSDNKSEYCFNNTDSLCVGGESSAGSNPVAIKGLQLMYRRNSGDRVTINGAWFKTAEPRVDPATGSFYYIEPQVRVYENGAFVRKWVTNPPTDQCNPTERATGPRDPNNLSYGTAVGYMPAASGAAERILSGVETYGDALSAGLFDSNGTLNGYSRHDAHLHAGRVWYSIFKTRERSEDSDPFSFYMLPKLSSSSSVDMENYASIADFGRVPTDADTEAGSAAGALPRIGLTENDAAYLNQSEWQNHVIVGFCIKAMRNEVIVGQVRVDRPALFGMSVQTFSPELKQK